MPSADIVMQLQITVDKTVDYVTDDVPVSTHTVAEDGKTNMGDAM